MSSTIETTNSSTPNLRKYANYDDHELDAEFRFYEGEREFREKVRECYDASLLESVRKNLWGTDHDDLRLLAEIHRQKAARLNQSYDPTIEVSSMKTLTSSNPDFEAWRTLFEDASVEELKDLAVHIQSEAEVMACERYRILHGMIFYKTGDEDQFVTAFDLNNRGAGLSVKEQKERLADTFECLDPVIGSLLFGFVQKITTNATDSSGAYGSAKNDGRWLNIISDTYAGGVSTVAHEVGHSIQYAFGVNCNSSIDNRDANSDLQKDFSVKKSETEFATAFQEEIVYLWNEFIDGTVDEVRSYQNKNFNEFFACAFEYWAKDKSTVEYTTFFNKHISEKQNCY